MLALVLALLLAPGIASAACPWSSIAVSGDAAFAIRDPGGALDCWGGDFSSGEALCGNVSASTFLAISGDELDACGVRTTGVLECWGSDLFNVVSGVPAGSSYTGVATGYDAACAIGAAGAVTCWGDGTGGANWVAPSASAFSQISGGQNGFCGIKTGGALECFGDVGPGASSGKPLLVSGLPAGTGYKQVDAIFNTACAVKSDDTLVCWGNNNNAINTEPGGTFTDVATNEWSGCGITTAGAISCWGSDTDEYPGVPGSGSYVALDAWTCSYCALTSTGDVVCWGKDGCDEIVTDAPAPACSAAPASPQLIFFVGA